MECADADSGTTTAYTDLIQSAYWYDEKDRIDRIRNVFPYSTASGSEYGYVRYAYTYDDSVEMTDGTAVGILEKFDILASGTVSTDITYHYDNLYRLKSKALVADDGFALTEGYTYRDQNTGVTTNQISVYSSKIGSAAATTYTFAYDEIGNIKIITDNAGKITQYDYDDMGQLIREDNPYLGKTYTYTYDNAGNRLSKTTYTYTTGTLGTATSTQNYSYNSTSAWGDQLSGYTYDEIGNPSYYNGYALTWSGLWRVLFCLCPCASNIYNQINIRLTRTLPVRVFFYNEITSERNSVKVRHSKTKEYCFTHNFWLERE